MSPDLLTDCAMRPLRLASADTVVIAVCIAIGVVVLTTGAILAWFLLRRKQRLRELLAITDGQCHTSVATFKYVY